MLRHFDVRPRRLPVAGRLDKSLIESVPIKVDPDAPWFLVGRKLIKRLTSIRLLVVAAVP
ncbi:MAG: hypothetical protein CR217_02460 [Beijerinckiaceae bacterium]|nr:MAG: hypothetical protein CR217_02460 [Beijerinckiaceae bacterium]